jgi:hypothetical protein
VDQVHVGRFFAEIRGCEFDVCSVSSELYAVWLGAVCAQVVVCMLTSPVAFDRLNFLDVALMFDQYS